MNEIWKHITGFKGLYMVSNLGNIKALERVWVTGRGTCRHKYEHLMKPVVIDGYLYVPFTKDGYQKQYSVHRIVAKEFIENPLNKRYVNHINGLKYDNRIENLEWVTAGENQAHAYRTGLKIPSDKKIKVLQFSLDDSFIKEWGSFKDITQTLGFDRSAIIRVCKKRTFTAYGYKWKYKNEQTCFTSKPIEESASNIQ